MFEPLERIPRTELGLRWQRVRDVLRRDQPEAGGLMVFSKVGVYYLAGTMAQGMVWLPLEGEPVLLVRRGRERAALESSLTSILPFSSFKDLHPLASEAGSPLSDTIAAEMGQIPWVLANSLTKYLSGARFVPGDGVLAKAMSLKTDWELAKMRLAGARHDQCVRVELAERIRPGMTEREISHVLWQVFMSHGHMGMMRMSSFGEEVFLGHVSAGDSGIYPSVFNGPLSLRGEHPAVLFMGYAGKVWQPGEPLGVDCGFSLEGYHTDKTVTFWAGSDRDVPDDVRRAQDFCIRIQALASERLRPGEIPSAIYADCLAMAEREGFAEGFMGLGENKVRFVGHGIGLTIDAWPVLAKGFDEPLQIGQVLAIEPKQGLPGLGMVGVENTFEVTEHGGRCITGTEYGLVCVES